METVTEMHHQLQHHNLGLSYVKKVQKMYKYANIKSISMIIGGKLLSVSIDNALKKIKIVLTQNTHFYYSEREWTSFSFGFT